MSQYERTTKLDIVNSALGKISISGITAPAMESDYSRVLNRLEGLMYELQQARNICCNYNFTEMPCGSDPHGMSFGLFEPIANILVLRVLSDYGIQPDNAMLAAANAAISSLHAQTFQLRETQYPRRQPRGAGNTLRYNRWQRFYRKPDRVPLICSTIDMDTGEVNDYTESFIDYLKPLEDIESYTLMHTGGLQRVSDREENGVIHYRLRALNPSLDNGVEQIRIKMTTTDGRVEERLISAEVLPITTDEFQFTSRTDA